MGHQNHQSSTHHGKSWMGENMLSFEAGNTQRVWNIDILLLFWTLHVLLPTLSLNLWQQQQRPFP